MSRQIFSYTNHSRMTEPTIFVSGSNDLVIDKINKKYYDCNSGLWNVNYGYNNSSYKNIGQIGLHFYPTHFWSSTEETEIAAELICNHFKYEKVFFGHSGSDAINTSIYISKWFNKKKNILAYHKGYHGSSVQAIIYNDYQSLLNAIDNDTSAIIIEPLMITNGIKEFDKNVLEEIFYLKKQYSFTVIFDETVTSLGRGDYNRIWPADILIASKGLTNGNFPLSAVLVNSEIAHYISKTNDVFSHGITTSGHPIGSNALCTTLNLYKETKNKTDEFISLFNRYDLNFNAHNMVFGIHVSDGINLRRHLQKEGYLIRQHDNTLLFLPMFTAEVSNYSKFAEIVATFQEYDR